MKGDVSTNDRSGTGPAAVVSTERTTGTASPAALKTAFRLLKDREAAKAAHLAGMRRAVREGIAAADQGRTAPIKGLLERVRARVEQRTQAPRRRKSA